MTPRRRRRAGTGDDGVSQVVGAILLFALFVSTIIVIQTTFVPVWDEEREARHMDEAAAQMATLAADLDRLIDNGTRGSIADPITLDRPAGFRLTGGARLPGQVSFDAAGGTGITLASPRVTIIQSSTQVFHGLAEPSDWLALDNINDTLTDVRTLRALRMRIDLSDPGAYNHGDSATLTVTDKTGAYAGHAEVTYLHIGGSERALETKVFSASGNEISADLESFFHNTDLGDFYVDLLDRNLLFDAVFAAAGKPATLEMVRTGLVASYVVVFDQQPGGVGPVTTVGTAGLVAEPYRPAPFPAGRLVFEPRHQQLPAQDLVLEHGALLRADGTGAAFIVPPRLQSSVAGPNTVLEWTLPTLSGGDAALAGPRRASMIAHAPVSNIDIRAWMANMTVDIPSLYPATWARALEQELRSAGLDAADGDYVLTTGADSVALTLEGLDADPDVDDVFLVFKQASIQMELRAS